MTFHAPQSNARLLSIIATRLVFSRSTLIAAGAIASTSVIFTARDGRSHIDFAEVADAYQAYTPVPGSQHPDAGQIGLASLTPFTAPNVLGRPRHDDVLIAPDTTQDQIEATIDAPQSPAAAQSQDYEPDIGVVFTDTQVPDYKTVSLEAPRPDWGTLNSVLGPRFPELGPVPLSPATPTIEADTAPDITHDENGPQHRTFTVAEGETLENLLKRAGVKDGDREATLIALRADEEDDGIAAGDFIDMAFGPENDKLLGIRLRQTDRIPLELRWDGETDPLWASLTVSDMPTALIASTVDTSIDGAADEIIAAESPLAMGSGDHELVIGEITSSLYGAATKAGLRPGDTQRVSNIFRYIVDFERDLRKGDSFEVLFDKEDDGSLGSILYAKLTNKGSEIALYRGEDEYGETGYFDASGRTNLRSIMRTPVAGAQVSSHFGMRRHPILGYNKMHRGVDFSAASGTPVYAAGNGVAEYVGRRGSYGKYIRVRHNSTFKTAYAHLSRYAAGLKSGQRVRQGEVIGYVGSTGRSTGPHLHFEILQDGARVNPMKVADFGPEKVLAGSELSRFKVQIARIEVAIGLLRDQPRYAAAD